jgi:tRNA A37 threonylcarbamoyltransferase TsaD
LAYKLINAGKNYNTKNILLAWWVSANDKLKNSLEEICEKKWLNFLSPKKKIYSMDNAAMVW